MKKSWVEILVISAIILMPVSIALRLIYGRQWREWEYELAQSWGVSDWVYDSIKIAILIGLTAYYLIQRRRKRKKEEARFYQLPKS
jgi:hypothetical protein